jgi:dTDP-4-dehydrorhamnose 3,5-epimerase
MPMPIAIRKTEIDGVLEVEGRFFEDDRGYFTELWSRYIWQNQGFTTDFVQDNISLSEKGALRGMHYQIHPHTMGKLVRCVHGAIFDVAVDLRNGSPHFGKWLGRELRGDSPRALWIPEGFAHGFLTLEAQSLVLYKCSGIHAPECERTLAWNCPEVGIKWPEEPRIISEKDAHAPGLVSAEYNFHYRI